MDHKNATAYYINIPTISQRSMVTLHSLNHWKLFLSGICPLQMLRFGVTFGPGMLRLCTLPLGCCWKIWLCDGRDAEGQRSQIRSIYSRSSLEGHKQWVLTRLSLVCNPCGSKQSCASTWHLSAELLGGREQDISCKQDTLDYCLSKVRSDKHTTWQGSLTSGEGRKDAQEHLDQSRQPCSHLQIKHKMKQSRTPY